ncbi:MAG: hypothetical protein IJ329_01775 [Clostridia bacterium]|nr:hypothetical protein [Clostridia bacterium]
MKLWKKTTTLLLALMLAAPCVLMTACGEEPPPTDDTPSGGDEITYQAFTYDATSTETPGSEFNRYQGVEGYYEISLQAGKTRYYSFSVSQAGQYALTTLEEKTGLTIERCDASEHYISPNTYPATVQEDGTLYSYVHCSTTHFNEYWRATYKISSTVDGIVKIRFERVGDPLREPEQIITSVTAQEIVGKAQNYSSEYAVTETPWLISESPSYFYDEDYEMTFTDLETGEEKTAKGFYRYGNKNDNTAPVIWVKLTDTPTRLFESATFATIQYEGNNLSLQTGIADNGDYLINNYVDFIMNNGADMYYPVDENGNTAKDPVPVEGDDKMLCYMNVTNSDGMYPVNQELFTFLNYYVSIKPPIFEEGVTVDKSNYWLAPCYYYELQVQGSEGYPLILADGENTVSATTTNVYYKLNSETATQYTFVGSEGLILYVNGKNHGTDGNGFTVPLDVPAGGITLVFKARTAGDYTVTATEITQ